MKPKYRYTFIIGGIAIVAVFAVRTPQYFFSGPAAMPAAVSSSSLPSSPTILATLIVFDGASTTFDASVPIFATSTVFSVLQSAMSSSGAIFAYKDYPGMGYLITKIGDKTNGAGGAYWQYWIDGAYATESADRATIHGGDTIDWKFTASQQ